MELHQSNSSPIYRGFEYERKAYKYEWIQIRVDTIQQIRYKNYVPRLSEEQRIIFCPTRYLQKQMIQLMILKSKLKQMEEASQTL